MRALVAREAATGLRKVDEEEYIGIGLGLDDRTNGNDDDGIVRIEGQNGNHEAEHNTDGRTARLSLGGFHI